MDRDTFMYHERFKAVSKAISELETAAMTFYDNDSRYDELAAILSQLEEYKKNYLY